MSENTPAARGNDLVEHARHESAPEGYGHPVAPPRVQKPADPEPKPKDTRSDAQLRADIQRARDELAQTLDALEYKLDVPARGRELLDSTTRTLARKWDDNPLLVGGIVAGAIVAIAGAITGIVALGRRNRDEF